METIMNQENIDTARKMFESCIESGRLPVLMITIADDESRCGLVVFPKYTVQEAMDLLHALSEGFKRSKNVLASIIKLKP